MGAFLKKTKEPAEKSGKEHFALVCRFHPNKIMTAHIIKEKDGKVKTGFHCPKCFCSNSGIPMPIPKPN